MSVLRSPPSPSSEPPAKKGKFATVDGDFEEEVAITEPVQDVAPKQRGKQDAKNKKPKPFKHRKPAPVDPVLKHDILTVLGWPDLPAWTNPPSEAASLGPRTWPKRGPEEIRRDAEINGVELAPEDANRWEFSEADFKVVGLTSHGDGIAVYPLEPEKPQWAVIIPFTLPGDRVRARVTRHAQYHSFAEPLQVISESPETTNFPIQLQRDNSLIGCKYFGTCAGCQYQSLPYQQQLALKRWVLQKAMKNFSGLAADEIPDVKETIPSPAQYGYRTKITPHFDLPKALQTKRRGKKTETFKGPDAASAKTEPQPAAEAMYNGEESTVGQVTQEFDVPIGFEEKCRSRLLDIEECPIATPAINKAMPVARENVKKNIRDYKKGATLLFRDCLVTETPVTPVADAGTPTEGAEVSVNTTKGKGKKAALQLSKDVKLKEPEEHICVSDHSQTITERVGKIIFQFPAGSFFQNNASILRPLTDFVREQIELDAREKEEDRYLVDAYCGSGLFSLTLASHFTKVCGIEIDPASIAYANHNATINSIDNVAFHSGASETLFDAVTKDLKWAGDKTTLIVDPPRKGCDAGFLKQVVAFLPRRVVYVSCNVHTMAENVGDLIRWSNEGDKAGKGYKISSVGAIDLFPQTHHTEGLLVLTRDV
ncbi:tRNA(m5U54)methyltransferase [Naganishia albida]|nr:tRNA(m5U54)methyltransferase [Naganishia albida]